MSSGPFTRTNRNTPQRNLNKSQQPTQASFTPSQPSTVTEDNNKGEYVYKPPTKIVRSNVNTVKEATKAEEKVQVKKQEPLKIAETQNKIQQSPVQKPTSFVRKPAIEITKETTVRMTTVTTEVTEIREEIKPVAIKSVSKLSIVRTKDPSSTSVVRTPRKQDKQEAPKVQQTPTKPGTSLYTRKKPTVEPKPQVKPTIIAKNQLQQLAQDPTKKIPNLQIKQPSPFYSYPKKIIRRQSEKQPQTQIQAKQQSSEAIEQPKPQTPKFSEHEKSQTPQMFTSTYTYHGKNANSQVSVQSSQSATTFKKEYQSVVHAPVEKVVQTQKPASTIVELPVKFPAKSTLSHVSRYSNKVETNVREEKVVDNQVSEQQQPKQTIKRSPMLGYALHRLYVQKMATNLQQFIQYAKNTKQTKANGKIHQYFERSLIRFVKVYEQNVLMRSFFGLMKFIFWKRVKLNMTKLTDSQVANQLTANRNQNFRKVLQNMIPSVVMEQRFFFLKLKLNWNEQKNLQMKRQIGVRILSGVEFRRMKENFYILIDWTKTKHESKLWRLRRCSQINSSYKKWLIVQSWTRLICYKLKQTSAQSKPSSHSKPSTIRPSITKTLQKPTIIQPQQHQTNLQLKQKVSQLYAKLSQVQYKNTQVPKESDLRKTLQQLKEQKSLISQEIATKKQRNSQLKQRLQTIMSKASHQQLSSLSQQKKQSQQQPTLSLLHDIYMNLYKQPQQQCTSKQHLNSLYTIHRVEQHSNSKQIVTKWLTISENLALKHWINLYEGNYVDEAGYEGMVGLRKQANKQMEEENELVKRFIRSYVKERYMWQEVKGYVQAVIGE